MYTCLLMPDDRVRSAKVRWLAAANKGLKELRVNMEEQERTKENRQPA